ncbi:hypothetical protein H6P81_007058 [Aristolochia fimbriata]|uniref:Uncharacterized protein n=1 Tax=Aristolochia fimbriata TaxID=158543 RepID=A0AAV7EZV2_ARIFI|nr:hypothetical protein H6P81_007058 [Aristolochia fimbriata]
MALPGALSSTNVVLSTAVRPDQNTVKPDNIVRPSAKFPPSVWGYFFVDFVQDEKKSDEWSRRAQVLKAKVKKILRDARGTPSEIHLVDVIKRVGLKYEFEEEIEDALYRIYNTTSIDIDSHGEKHDHLYHEATHFRVLREGGYKASADVFQKYKNEDGKSFKEELTRDVKGLLSLYEAAFLEIRGEDILDEAIAFTTQHLKYFISFYEENQGKTSDPDILSSIIECAKLEYNLVQALYQREIKEVSKWWKESGLVEKLPYARDRVVECYVWMLSSAPEPRFSRSRIVCIRSQRSYLCMGQAAKPLCGIFVEEEHPLASNVTKSYSPFINLGFRFPSSFAACWLPLRRLPLVGYRSSVTRLAAAAAA